MSAAEKIVNGNTETKTRSGIAYYDDDIFPRMEKGDKVFNWYAGLFPGYWLTYKGLWTTYAKWVVPFTFFCAFLETMNLRGAILVAYIGFAAGIGRESNKIYYKHLNQNPKSKSNALLGVGGLIVTLMLNIFATNFASSFVSSFKSSLEKARNPSSVNSQTMNDSKVYQKSSLAIMDGEKAVGSILKFSGTYLGLQTVQDTPVILVVDVSGGTNWWITFSDKYKESISQMKVGSAHEFSCIIEQIGTAMNVCSLQ